MQTILIDQFMVPEDAALGFRPPEIMQRLGVTMRRATYHRAPY